MNVGPRNMQISSEADPGHEDLAEHAPDAEHPLQPDRARALHEHAVAGTGHLLEQRTGLLGRRHRLRLAVEAGGVGQRVLAHRYEQIDPARRACSPISRWYPPRVLAELGHRAEHGYPALGGLSARWSRAARIDIGLAL